MCVRVCVQNEYIFPFFFTRMSLAQVRDVVCRWYGVSEMPMRILTKEADIVRWELEHPEVPPVVWELVDHDVRLVREWGRSDVCVDLVVYDETTKRYRMVQDICFLEAYPDAIQWRQAVLNLIKNNERVWVVDHDV